MLRYVHHTPKGASGRSYPPSENMRSRQTLVNNGTAGSASGHKRSSINHFIVIGLLDRLDPNHTERTPALKFPSLTPTSVARSCRSRLTLR